VTSTEYVQCRGRWWIGLVLAAALGFSACDLARSGEAAERMDASGDRTETEAEPPPPSPPAPATVGLDGERIAAALAAAEELPRLRCLLIARHGEIQAERCYRGPGLDGYANIKSVSKSVLSAAVGIAFAEGLLESPEQSILPFFSQYVNGEDATARSDITIGHLLTMQSGLDRTSGNNYGAWVMSPNWVRYAITRPLIGRPGEQRIYSTGNSHLLSAILTQAAGRSTWEYTRDKLTDPLGIRLPRWPTDPQGIFFGGNDMLMTPRDMVRFGELFRNGGRHDGRQIVPEEWVTESLSPRSRSRMNDYGYGWFLSDVRGHPMFYASGYGGQFIFVVPELELTVVTTSHPDDPRTQGHNQSIQRILRDLIVPAAEIGA
jgi:CubicO group peptidase (beta-lactamase class C family)